jgi:AbiU2
MNCNAKPGRTCYSTCVTDPPISAGKHTLTIRRLPDLVSDASLRLELTALVDDARSKTAFARDWRNRRLAHKELHRSQPLASASRKHIEDALAAIRLVINRLEQTYLNKTVSYEHTIPDLGGVASLILVLRKGVETRRAEREAKLAKQVVA